MADSTRLEWESKRANAVIRFRAIDHQLLLLSEIRFTHDGRLELAVEALMNNAG